MWMARLRERVKSGRAGWVSLVLAVLWTLVPTVFCVGLLGQSTSVAIERGYVNVPNGSALMFVRTADGLWEEYDTGLRSADELTKLLGTRPGDVSRGLLRGRMERWGWPFEMWKCRMVSVCIEAMGGNQNELENDATLRRAVAAACVPMQNGWLMVSEAQLAKGEARASMWLIDGIVANSLLLVLGSVWLWATYRFGLILAPMRAARRRRAIERGVCPECQYDVSVLLRSGIEVCPECGGSLVIPGVGAA